jgi:hypothetical protein
MSERRKNGRFALPKDMTGFFQHQETTGHHSADPAPFVIKDIGYGGANLISNYLPDIGREYRLTIAGRRGDISLPVQVVYSNIFDFLTDDDGIFQPGIVYSIGCRIMDMDEKQKSLIKYFIQDRTPI